MGKLVNWYVRKPHAVLAVLLFLSVLGIIGFKEIPRKFFPDANRPQVAVITVEPGASAEDVASYLSVPIERELKTLDGVRKVTSTSKDGVSVVIAEFEYRKKIDEAATEVSNALSRVAPKLPREALTPQVYKITDATNPVMVLAVYPKEGSHLTLAQVRQMAENEIKAQLLNLPHVSNVEVFGGYEREVLIEPDYLKMARLGVNLYQLIKAIRESNVNAPAGFFINKNGMVAVKLKGEVNRIEELKNLTVKPGVLLKDLATVKWGYKERFSAYHGDGKRAIGISILRSPNGYELPAIESVKAFLPTLKREYPQLNFKVTDTQEWLIKLSNKNMLESLRDAIVMTLLVIFLFLANLRMLFVSFFSIPLTYLITIALMWLLGFNFNVVTLTGVILALGMLVDDAVVVLENVERHYYELKKDPFSAAVDGTKEVMLAVLSGTYTTVLMLLPLTFIGGYTQHILKPLASVLIIALLVSYFVAVTIIPILAPHFLKKVPTKNLLERSVYKFFVEGVVFRLRDFYSSLIVPFLGRFWLKLAVVVLGFAIVPLVVKNAVPVLGRDLMPPMDTGIVIVKAEADANTSLEKTEEILSKMEKLLYTVPGVIRVSSTVGSEPGVLSFGSGKSPQQIEMKVQFVDRFHRKKTIWQIEDELRRKFAGVPGLRWFAVYDFGATPLSSIKATVDETILGPDQKVLNRLGQRLESLMKKVKGLTAVNRNWYPDKEELIVKVNSEQLARYGLTPLQVVQYLGSYLKGVPASSFVVPGENSLVVRVILPSDEREFARQLENLPVPTKAGLVPLSYFVKFEKREVPTLITHYDLINSLSVRGYRSTAPTTFLQEQVNRLEKQLKLPAGYEISHEGEIKQMKESFTRLGKALAIGVVLLYFSLVPAFESFTYPISILSAIPLAVVGGILGLLIANKPQCMPAFMGLILLAGIIVKNSILLIDFFKFGREKGKSVEEAVVDAVKVRTRPVLMTAFGTSVGMVPIALGWALGLERLAPLAAVAIGGLLLGTFLTLFFVPLLLSLIEDLKSFLRG
jgi:multidrug efflux pump subunit AcrB